MIRAPLPHHPPELHVPPRPPTTARLAPLRLSGRRVHDRVNSTQLERRERFRQCSSSRTRITGRAQSRSAPFSQLGASLDRCEPSALNVERDVFVVRRCSRTTTQGPRAHNPDGRATEHRWNRAASTPNARSGGSVSTGGPKGQRGLDSGRSYAPPGPLAAREPQPWHSVLRVCDGIGPSYSRLRGRPTACNPRMCSSLVRRCVESC